MPEEQHEDGGDASGQEEETRGQPHAQAPARAFGLRRRRFRPVQVEVVEIGHGEGSTDSLPPFRERMGGPEGGRMGWEADESEPNGLTAFPPPYVGEDRRGGR
ncbi:MAG: hypothetical protein DMF79_03645 [Acidobacteria bacterium]|nr:MAG: hypothetical protein DMF79_03645 [Acidobacteriota bacterium]